MTYIFYYSPDRAKPTPATSIKSLEVWLNNFFLYELPSLTYFIIEMILVIILKTIQKTAEHL